VARLLIILALLATGFWVYSVVDCAVQPRIRHRAVPKAVWMLIVIVFPVIGGALWFLLGRIPAHAALRAPDDDPAFLSTLRTRSAQDDRIRQLEEELARLDKDADGDDDPPHDGRTGRGGH